jgi:FPC/CPF motif-containing protein YcgG
VVNPYVSRNALAHSCYVEYVGPRKHQFAKLGTPVKRRLTIHIHEQLRAFIQNLAFPCHLGRSSVANLTYRFGLYPDMLSDECLEGLCRDLWDFVEERPRFSEFSTMLVSFEGPLPTNEIELESNLWNLLQRLHSFDRSPWATNASSDPNDPDFAFSFASEAFFIVGMHGHSSRYSRRFPYPTLAFNAQSQFDELRKLGQFDKAQRVIRNNDVLLQGDINPSLANFGDDSAAKQYSGRLVENDRKCPFLP